VGPTVASGPDELAAAYRRLSAAYEQARQYAHDVRQLYHRMQRAVCQSLLGLANALEAKDPYTRGHSERVAAWARRLALDVGVPAGEADEIAQAGLLHDIGKIGVPEAVLRKPGALDPGELGLMRRHPLVGAHIVAPFEFFADVSLVIRHHHERWDGSGYPDRLAGDAIPLGARIVAVADVYDALTSDRPYRRALPAPEARAHLTAAAGVALDAALVRAFLDLPADDARR
jgi:putative nucleotidyltransferase with HDIG domain